MGYYDKSIDVMGTCCLMPLVRMTEAISTMSPGQILEVTGDDPFFESGVRDYCLARGHAIVGVAASSRAFTIRIRI